MNISPESAAINELPRDRSARIQREDAERRQHRPDLQAFPAPSREEAVALWREQLSTPAGILLTIVALVVAPHRLRDAATRLRERCDQQALRTAIRVPCRLRWRELRERDHFVTPWPIG